MLFFINHNKRSEEKKKKKKNKQKMKIYKEDIGRYKDSQSLLVPRPPFGCHCHWKDENEASIWIGRCREFDE